MKPTPTTTLRIAPGQTPPVMNRGCCGGKDFGPVRAEELPLGADMRCAQTAASGPACPACRTELFDDDTACPTCGRAVMPAVIAERSSSAPLLAMVGAAGVLIAGLLVAAWL
jgi:hypothetical protein